MASTNQCLNNTCFQNCEILNWSDFKTSGLVLGSINLLFFSALFSGNSLITVFTNFALLLLLVSIGVCYASGVPEKDE